MNAEYINGLIVKVNAIPSCDELQQAANEVIADIEAQAAALAHQLERYTAMQILAQLPTSPTAVITWIQNYYNLVIAPQIAPYAILAIEIEQTLDAVQNLKAAIQNKAAQLDNCSITIAP